MPQKPSYKDLLLETGCSVQLGIAARINWPWILMIGHVGACTRGSQHMVLAVRLVLFDRTPFLDVFNSLVCHISHHRLGI